MKNKGFTLIELLAVIVILAIVMIIAIPQVIDVIEKSEMESYRESVELMIHTAEVQYNADEVRGAARIIPEEGLIYEYSVDGKDTIQTQESIDTYGYLDFKGDKPRSGSITMTKKKKFIVDNLVSKMRNGKYCAIKELDEQHVTVGKSTNMGCSVNSDEEEVVQDKKPCELEVDSSDNNILYVDSASDLYRLSQDVNNGTNYYGKTIKVRNNLDMSKAKGTCVGDYEPIGNYSKPFKGTFDGGAKTISNLTINNPNKDQLGLFGGSEGTIKGVILNNINITGRNYVSALVGYANHGAQMKEILLKNININGNNYVGAINGAHDNNSSMTNIVIRGGTVHATNQSGLVHGYLYNSRSSNVVIEELNYNYGSSNASISSLNYSNKFKENGTVKADYQLNISDINVYETIGMDTWISGDNDSSGYYWDYENSTSKVITLKSVSDNTFKNTLEGNGTNDSPYLIKNANDWKNATLLLKANKVFKLTQDIDFSGKHFYMFGTSQNEFTGKFLGGANTIKNVKIIANRSGQIGVFGSIRNSTILGLKLSNIEINAYNAVGPFVGYAWAGNIMKEILLDGANITGYYDRYVGGLIGAHDNNSSLDTAIIRNETITSPNNLGLVTGYYYNSPSRYVIVENMTVNAGSITDNTSNLGVSNNVIINGNRKTDGYNPANTNDINYYASMGLDTWIGGDNNSSGYYVDYDSTGKLTIKDMEKDPMTFDLSGSGTASSPWLIKNENDWKKMTLKLNQSGIYFKLTKDLNFSNNKYYMLGLNMHGNYQNPFRGVLDGGAHTIKNITINAHNVGHIGIIGDLSGASVYGLNIIGATVNAGGCSGVFSYINYSSRVMEIAIKDVTINTAAGSYGGIITGALDNSSILENILVKNVTFNGKSDCGYAQGYKYSSTARNLLYEKVNMNATNTHWNVNSEWHSTLTKENGTSISGGFDPSYIDDLDYYTNKIETKFNGDSNNTGYYFDYDSAKGGIFVVPTNNKNGWVLVNEGKYGSLSGTNTWDKHLKEQKWTYFKSDGTRITSGWHELKDLSNQNKWYYFEGGYTVNGWKTIDGHKYYFSERDADGNHAIDQDNIRGTSLNINGVNYTFDSSGICTNCN